MRKNLMEIDVEKLKQYMQEMGIAPMELSERCGLSRQSIHMTLSGSQDPKIESVEKIVNALNKYESPNGWVVRRVKPIKMSDLQRK